MATAARTTRREDVGLHVEIAELLFLEARRIVDLARAAEDEQREHRAHHAFRKPGTMRVPSAPKRVTSSTARQVQRVP